MDDQLCLNCNQPYSQHERVMPPWDGFVGGGAPYPLAVLCPTAVWKGSE
jgi:hypothetical protein